MRCGNCGVDIDSSAAFCPSCGRSTSPVPASAGANFGRGSTTASSGIATNVAGALCYLAGFVTGIFFLVTEPYKKDQFVRFHAFQSIFFCVAWFASYFVLAVFAAILPGMLWRVGWLLRLAVGLGFFLAWFFVIFKAYNHDQYRLPLIGDLAAKQA